jgi:hypothetical protein
MYGTPMHSKATFSMAQCTAKWSTEAAKMEHLLCKEVIGSPLWVANSTRSTISSAASMFKPSIISLQDQYIGRHFCMNLSCLYATK